MLSASLVTWLFVAALLSSASLRLWLATRQMRHVALHRDAVPPAFASSVSLEAHRKAADYTLAKGRLGLLTLAWSTALVLGWTLLGGLGWLDDGLRAALLESWGEMGYQLALLASFVLIGSLLELPWEWYATFHLEARFGFNRSTPALFWADQAKGLLVGAIVGLPLAAVILWLMARAGSAWWLWAWGVWVGFNLLIMVIYPTLIAPLFNKFEPLADEALRQRVARLMERCGFAAKGLFVMDGSRRSAHGNAYFTGLGAAKRVVFFDTLLAKLSHPEVEAVLAHELGHFKHRHVHKRMLGIFAASLAGLALLGWLANQSTFYLGLGVRPHMGTAQDAMALLLFALALPPFGFFLGPLAALWSRRHEFEADAFACRQADGSALASALLKLHEDNASTLTPDPLYARFYYSHPPAAERLAALPLAAPMNSAAAVAPAGT